MFFCISFLIISGFQPLQEYLTYGNAKELLHDGVKHWERGGEFVVRHSIPPPVTITNKVFHITKDTVITHSVRMPSRKSSSSPFFYVFIKVLALSKNNYYFRFKPTVAKKESRGTFMRLVQSRRDRLLYTQRVKLMSGKMIWKALKKKLEKKVCFRFWTGLFYFNLNEPGCIFKQKLTSLQPRRVDFQNFSNHGGGSQTSTSYYLLMIIGYCNTELIAYIYFK